MGHWVNGSRRSGVRRTRSAAARRGIAEKRSRKALSRSRDAALRAQASAGRPVASEWWKRQRAAVVLESARMSAARWVRWVVAQRVVQ
jgi:hypothetical protein